MPIVCIADAVHVYNLANRLNDQRKEGHFCDVILRVAGCAFPTHASVLSAASPFFQTLISGGSPVSVELPQEIELVLPDDDGGDAESFGSGLEVVLDLLDYIYTGKIMLKDDRADLIIQLAEAFTLESLASLVRSYVVENSLNSNIPTDPSADTPEVEVHAENDQAHIRFDDLAQTDLPEVVGLVPEMSIKEEIQSDSTKSESLICKPLSIEDHSSSVHCDSQNSLIDPLTSKNGSNQQSSLQPVLESHSVEIALNPRIKVKNAFKLKTVLSSEPENFQRESVRVHHDPASDGANQRLVQTQQTLVCPEIIRCDNNRSLTINASVDNNFSSRYSKVELDSETFQSDSKRKQSDPTSVGSNANSIECHLTSHESQPASIDLNLANVGSNHPASTNKPANHLHKSTNVRFKPTNDLPISTNV